ncbi:glycosyl transferase family 1 [Palleronia aestuarii]|uniref:Glycosyl transferase family 1 n=1 Tax=Palleronia aestuarii TaxID=568105 RepID=A0A2W7NLZ7_9RHOB|nr:glycosyltransferase [Palleronia aestuarii]PZX19127.1 glycosyl transferase family 1 [Palleronia aestuarii]
MADLLIEAGHEAHPLFPFPDHVYAYYDGKARPFHDPRLERFDRQVSRRRRLDHAWRIVRRAVSRGKVRHPKIDLRPSDIVVVPEYQYPELADIYGPERCVLLAQDVMGFARAFLRDTSRERPCFDQFGAIVTTSEASHRGVRELTGIDTLRVTLSISQKKFRFVEDKRLQIAVMPRKHAFQSQIVLNALRRDPDLSDVRIVVLQNMPEQDLLKGFGESLIFLSFSHQEGFGLPPAEAMATGAIVIGYQGVGGSEYFDETTGFPIDADDISAMIGRTREIVRAYRSDPQPLDELRRRASRRILSTYTVERFRETTLQVFEEVANHRSPS